MVTSLANMTLIKTINFGGTAFAAALISDYTNTPVAVFVVNSQSFYSVQFVDRRTLKVTTLTTTSHGFSSLAGVHSVPPPPQPPAGSPLFVLVILFLRSEK